MEVGKRTGPGNLIHRPTLTREISVPSAGRMGPTRSPVWLKVPMEASTEQLLKEEPMHVIPARAVEPYSRSTVRAF